MANADTLSLSLLALAAVIGGVVVFRQARSRRRNRAMWAGQLRWPTTESSAYSANGDFQPTRVMSYAEAVREGWFEAPSTLSSDMAPAELSSVDAVAPLRPLRVKLQGRDGTSRFVTMSVLRLVVENNERTVHARLGNADRIERIPLSRIEAAIDLQGKAKIDDPWTWLRTQLGVVSRIERSVTGSWPSSRSLHDTGSIDTAGHAA